MTEDTVEMTMKVKLCEVEEVTVVNVSQQVKEVTVDALNGRAEILGEDLTCGSKTRKPIRDERHHHTSHKVDICKREEVG